MHITFFGKALIVAVLLVAALGLPAAFAATPPSRPAIEPAKPQTQPRIKVTYLLFSGRPNPTLTIAQGRTFDQVAQQLGYAVSTGARSAKRQAPPVLGYNGILVESFDARGKVSRYVVKDHDLRDESAKAGQATTTSASAGDLEQTLLVLGRERGVLDAQLLGVIGNASKR